MSVLKMDPSEAESVITAVREQGAKRLLPDVSRYVFSVSLCAFCSSPFV